MDVDTWIEAQPARLQEDLRTLHAAIAEVVPDLAIEVGAMLSYGPFRYRYVSGREGTSALVSVAVRAHGLSVYVNSVDGDTYLAEAAAAALGKVKVGRSCITLKRAADLDLEAFRAVLRRARELGGAGEIGR